MHDFIKLYSALDKECRYYSRHLGHIKGLLNNDDWLRVVGGSHTGRVLLMGNSEIQNALVLFNTRMFDRGRDTVTLLKLGSCIPEEADLVDHHNQRMVEIDIEYDTKRYFQPRNELVSAMEPLEQNETADRLRSLRTCVLAHNIEPETVPKRATLTDLVQLTEKVLEIVDIAGYLVNSSRNVYRDFVARSEEETREFLSILPKLSERENI